jgi:hypothetical protein
MDDQLDDLEVANTNKAGGTITATAGGDQTTIFANK